MLQNDGRGLSTVTGVICAVTRPQLTDFDPSQGDVYESTEIYISNKTRVKYIILIIVVIFICHI